MRKLGIGTTLAFAGVVALVAGGIALATGGDETTVRQVNEGYGPAGIGPGHEGFRGRGSFRGPSAKQVLARREEFAKALGKELDKSSDEVLDAFRSVFKQRLDKAVEEENLTQKQADQILECFDSAKCGPPGFGGGGPPGFGGPGGPPSGM